MNNKECFESEDEREKYFDRISKWPLCPKETYDLVNKKVDTNVARFKDEAFKQIAEETGKPESAVRATYFREQKRNQVALQPDCDPSSQAPICSIPHVAQNTGDNEWYTPPEFIDAARNLMGEIDCDPASSEIANQTIKAKKFYTISQDGRDKEWGDKVWMNPPYAQPLIADFSTGIVDRLESGEVEEACVLVNNATETNWFQNMLGKASAVVFIKSRVRFLDPEGNPGAPLQGQCILYFGDNSKDFYEEFNKFGIVLFHAEPF